MQRSFLFLLSSTREGSNSEWLARQAAASLGPDVEQQWIHLHQHSLEPFVDIRHSVGVYPEPQGNAKFLLESTLAATDLVIATPLYWYSLPTPLYWYSLPTPLKHYLDYWSGWMRVPNLNFRARMAGKRMWVICVSSGDPYQAEPLFASLKFSAEYMQMEWAGAVLGNGSKPGDVQQDLEAIEKAKLLFA